MERARANDTEAWKAIFDHCYPRLLTYTARRLPTPEQAEDAVAETITRAMANIDQLRNDGAGFDAWMYGIARHVVLDAHRKGAREQLGVVPDTPDTGAQPAERALDLEDAVELRAAFDRLAPSDQQLLALRIVAERSVSEVAAALGRTPTSVRMAQSRALARLRALLAQAPG